MKSRNPMVGRHGAGTPLGAPVQPKPRTGSPSGKFVGTGVNAKTAQKPEYRRVKPAPAQNYTAQAEQFTRSAPEPFRNPQSSQNPNPLQPKESGDGIEAGSGGAYKPFRGSRVSINDGINPSSAAGVSRARNASGGYPGNNVAGVGISGARGRGSENGKVAGLAQPRRSGSPFTQGRFTQSKSTRPSFYGR